ncbi:hypothetical protein [Phytohabitans suffuscus]|uniref:MftR C-terminal domain-containing protein n=1 Tax=Phytohabitans suffuscus TaxID=624315 RepID=A0A6F8YV07_9ACTN|nr:hypothetical protein [Phytohabitans suffuscus]BCB89990.1 hypothetical protein Psuf_073030 [Phytohabitans suffuscus]
MAAFTRYNLQWQPQLRSALRLSLEPPADRPAPDGSQRPLLRGGRAIAWVEDALAPLQHSHPHLDRRQLAVAIRSATGIESLVWLQDVAGQTPDQAAETVRRTARALLDAALRG